MVSQVLSEYARQDVPNETEILRSTLYHLHEGVVVADKDGRFLICNHIARTLLSTVMNGKIPQAWSEITGAYKMDGVTPYEREELPSLRALSGEDFFETEILVRNELCPAGLWLSVRANPLRKENGEIFGSIVFFHDVTRKKSRDTQLQILTNAVEQTADSIIITDRAGLIEYVNPAFETTTGYTLNELKGLTPRVINSGVHNPEFYENLWATILSGKVFRTTMANKKKNGEVFFAAQTITPMFGSTGIITNFVTVFKDVTEQRKLQEQQFQISLARAIQQQFYEAPLPQIKDFDFAAAAFPADAIGGDYFDFIHMSDGSIGIAIGDVCGHGLSSALLMAELRAYLRAFTAKSHNPAEIFSLTNSAMVSDMGQAHFVTLVYCRLHPESRRLVYASAGHTPGFIFDKDGNVKRTLDSIDIPLGFMEGHVFEHSEPIALESGDIIALLTDGIIEAERPDQQNFGVERAIEHIRAHRRESAREIVDGLYQAVRSFSDGMQQADDITAVICKMRNEGE